MTASETGRRAVDLLDLDPRLLRLTYASRASWPLSREDLSQLAQQARRRNRRLHVTGLLLYMDREFLQVLEGPAAAVEAVFDSIERDPRNMWVTRLSAERVLRRAFGQWAMGCFELRPQTGVEPVLEPCDGGDAPPRVRPRSAGDFSVFLDQFYARNRARGGAPGFARVG
jgi:hypothetical protein